MACPHFTASQGAQTATQALLSEATLTGAHMTEPRRGLLYLPIIYLWTGKSISSLTHDYGVCFESTGTFGEAHQCPKCLLSFV